MIALKPSAPFLVFAMILIPASTVYQLTHSLTQMTLYSMLIGMFCGHRALLVLHVHLPSGLVHRLFYWPPLFLAVCCSRSDCIACIRNKRRWCRTARWLRRPVVPVCQYVTERDEGRVC